jgi:hypothetical protein
VSGSAAPVICEHAPVTHGIVNRTHWANGVVLTETTHPLGTRLPLHSHAHPAVTLVLRGGFTETFEGDTATSAASYRCCSNRRVQLTPIATPAAGLIRSSSSTPARVSYRGLERLTPQIGSGPLVVDGLRPFGAFRSKAPEAAIEAEELGITSVGAAVANAIYNATGKRVRELPITLDKLLGTWT